MANVNAPRGALPMRRNDGSTAAFTFNPYTLVSGLAQNIFFGDVVKYTTTGVINLVTSAEQARGIFQGCEYTDATGTRIKSKYWPSGTVATNIVCYVIDDPNISFEMQFDIAMASGSAAAQGKIYNLTGTVSGSTADGLSRSQLTYASQSSISGGLVRVLSFINRPDNDSSSAQAFAKVECVFASHDFRVNAGV